MPIPAAVLPFIYIAVAAFVSLVIAKILAPSFPNARKTKGFKQTVTEPVAERRIVYGTRMISGPIVFLETGGEDNANLMMIIALTTHPVEDITHALINNDLIRISGSPKNPGYEENDLAWREPTGSNENSYMFAHTTTATPTVPASRPVRVRWEVQGNHANSIAHPPLTIIKVNGWANATGYYVPDQGDVAGQDWFDDDVVAMKTMSNMIFKLKAFFSGAITLPIEDATPWQYDSNGEVTNPSTNRYKNWNEHHKLTNCSYVFVNIKFNKNVPHRTSIPQIRFIVKGKRVYDPTDDNDSDYTNISRDQASELRHKGAIVSLDGSQDYHDPTTWKQTSNWALCILDYLLDPFYGVSALTNGPGTFYAPSDPLDYDEINWASFAKAIADSDEYINRGDFDSSGAPDVPRYTIDAVLSTTTTPIQNLDDMLSAGAGWLTYSQGQYALFAGVYEQPFSANDIINEDYLADAELEVSTSVSRSAMYNKATGLYIKVGLVDEVVDNVGFGNYIGVGKFPVYETSEFPLVSPQLSGSNPYEDEDGEEIIHEFDFPFTTSEFLAQRLAKIALEKTRNSLLFKGVFKSEILEWKVGNRVYVTNERLGWDISSGFSDDNDSNYGATAPKQFIITNMTINPDFTISVSFQEEHSLFYDWNDGDALPDTVAPNTALDPAELGELPSPPTWDVFPTGFMTDPVTTEMVTDASGSLIPVTTLVWTQDFDSNALATPSYYQVEYGQITDSSPSDQTSSGERENVVERWISAGIAPYLNVENYINEGRDNEDPSFPIQGYVNISNLDNTSPSQDPDNAGDIVRYDFRIRTISIRNVPSHWVYYAISTYAPSDGFGHRVGIDEIPPQAPTNLIVTAFVADNFLSIEVYNDDNVVQDMSHIRLLMSGVFDDPYDVFTSAEFLVPTSRKFGDLTADQKIVPYEVTIPGNTIRYFWAAAVDTTGNESAFYPPINEPGILGTLEPVSFFFIKSLRGTSIKHSSGTLGIEAFGFRQGGGLPQLEYALTTGDIKLWLSDGSSGYTAVPTGEEYLWDPIDATDIDSTLTVYLRDDVEDINYDTISLTDITDTIDIQLDNYVKNVWRKSGGTWDDTNTESMDITVYENGIIVAKDAVSIDLREPEEDLHAENATHSGGNMAEGDIAITANESPLAEIAELLTIKVIYTSPTTGASKTVYETFYTAVTGSDGTTGSNLTWSFFYANPTTDEMESFNGETGLTVVTHAAPAFDIEAYSGVSFGGACSIQFQVNQTDENMIFGVSQNPVSNPALEYGFYFHDDGQRRVWDGVSVEEVATEDDYFTTDIFEIRYDGVEQIHFFQNGIWIWSLDVSLSEPLQANWAPAGLGSISDIYFNAVGTAAPNSAAINLYKQYSTQAVPGSGDLPGDINYYFNTGIYESTPPGLLNGWSGELPTFDSANPYTYTRQATAFSTRVFDRILDTEWSDPAVLFTTDSTKTAIATIYKRVANDPDTTPLSAPDGNNTYTFATALMSGSNLDGWSSTFPSGPDTDPVWARTAVAAGDAIDLTDTISSGQWSGAVHVTSDGIDGEEGPEGPSGGTFINWITPINSPNWVEVSEGNTKLTTVSDDSGWNALAYSLETFQGGAFLSCVPDSPGNDRTAIALDVFTSESDTTDRDDLSYAWSQSTGIYTRIYINGNITGETVVTADIVSLQIIYDNIAVRFYANGVLHWTEAVPPDLLLTAVFLGYDDTGSFKGVNFGPTGAAGFGTNYLTWDRNVVSPNTEAELTESVNNTRVDRIAQSAPWDTEHISIQTYIGGCDIRWKMGQTTTEAVVGLTIDPYDSVEVNFTYNWYFIGDGTLFAAVNGTATPLSSPYGDYTTAETYGIRYDNNHVTWLVDDVVVFRVAVHADIILYANIAFKDIGFADNITFTDVNQSTAVKTNQVTWVGPIAPSNPGVYISADNSTIAPAFSTVTYDLVIYSLEAYQWGVKLDWTNSIGNNSRAVGLSSPANKDATGSLDMDYGFIIRYDEMYLVRVDDTDETSPVAFIYSDTFSIIYDNETIRWYVNGISVYEEYVGPDLIFHARIIYSDINIHSNRVENIIFTDYPSIPLPGQQITWVHESLDIDSYQVDTNRGQTLTKAAEAAPDTYDSESFSLEGYEGGVVLQFTNDNLNHHATVGFTEDPSLTPEIEWALIMTSGSQWGKWDGSDYTALGTWSGGDTFRIKYDGNNVHFYRNGAHWGSFSDIGLNKTFYANIAIKNLNHTIDGITYLPIGSSQSIHTASVFKRSYYPPDTPDQDDGSYNFATNNLNPPTGWTEGLPTYNGLPLWVSNGTFAVTDASLTDLTVLWGTPTLYSPDVAQNTITWILQNDGNAELQALYGNTQLSREAFTGAGHGTAYSTNPLHNGCVFSCIAPDEAQYLWRFGLSETKTDFTIDSAIDWEWHVELNAGTGELFKGVASVGTFSYVEGDILDLSYDGAAVTILVNGSVKYTESEDGFVSYYCAVNAENADGTTEALTGIQFIAGSVPGTPGTPGTRGSAVFDIVSVTGFTSHAAATSWAGTLLDASAELIARTIMETSGVALDGFIRLNDQIRVQQGTVPANTALRIYIGADTDDYTTVDAVDFSTKVIEHFHGSVIVDDTLSADKFAANLAFISQLTMTGTLPHIKGGMTDYDTGTGFFLGWDTGLGKWVFSIGDDGGNKLTWDGTDLTVYGEIIQRDYEAGDHPIIADENPSFAQGGQSGDFWEKEKAFRIRRDGVLRCFTTAWRWNQGSHAAVENPPSFRWMQNAVVLGSAWDVIETGSPGANEENSQDLTVNKDYELELWALAGSTSGGEDSNAQDTTCIISCSNPDMEWVTKDGS